MYLQSTSFVMSSNNKTSFRFQAFWFNNWFNNNSEQFNCFAIGIYKIFLCVWQRMKEIRQNVLTFEKLCINKILETTMRCNTSKLLHCIWKTNLLQSHIKGTKIPHYYEVIKMFMVKISFCESYHIVHFLLCSAKKSLTCWCKRCCAK